MANIIFDLDGTLIDSAADIQSAVNKMLDDIGQPALDLPTVISFIGQGVPRLVEQVMDHLDLSHRDHSALTQSMLAHYTAAPHDQTSVFSGVTHALHALAQAGHRLGICTNKPYAPALGCLEALGLSPYFDAVVGGDSVAVKKPDPAHLFACAQMLGDGPILFVGDSDVDAETAKRAGVPFLLFTQGYRKAEITDLYHTAAFDSYSNFDGLVRKVLST